MLPQVNGLMNSTHFNLLYVCNGDNARAPLAAACTKRLTDADGRGISWTIDSAGTEAVEGSWIRTEARRGASVIGLDVSEHVPCLLTGELCDDPDLILAMSWEQVSHIWSLVPGSWDKVFTLKEFIHWSKRAPIRPPILFPNRIEQMRDKVIQAHAIRKRARADYGFWGGIRPQDLNLIEPNGKGDEAWSALALAVQALTTDVITLLTGPETHGSSTKAAARSGRRPSRPKSKAKAKPKAKAKAKVARR
jgi:protein-tyrosine-phosphatase